LLTAGIAFTDSVESDHSDKAVAFRSFH